MATLKRYMQLVLMIAAIAVLYYLPLDWAIPYVLPITAVGVIVILSFVFMILKRRGLLAFALIGLLTVSTQVKAYDIINCGGSYKNSGNAILNAIQDAALNGNTWKSDFNDKAVLACVIVNIANLHSEICGGVGQIKDTYDPKVRAKAFYVMDNYYRMNVDEGTDDVDGRYVSDLIATSGNQALINAHAAASQHADQIGGDLDSQAVFKCAKEYTEKAAKIDRANESNCGTVMNKIKENSKDCWVCDIVHLVIESVQLMAGNTYQLMQWLALRLLGVIFLFWIAIKVLIFIGHMGYADNGEFMTDMLVRLIVVAIAAAILHAPIIDFYRIVISPFVGISANLAGKFTEMSMTDGQKTFAEIVESRAGANTNDICVYCTNMNDPDFKFERKREGLQTTQGNTVYAEVMDDQTINGILCLTCKVFRQVTPFIAVGEMFSCHANAAAKHIPLTPIYIPNFLYLIVGYLIIIPFSILAVIVGFYLIDIVLRLGFVIVLTPLYIVAWAFPISREYSTKAWHVILYSLLQFIGVAVMIALFLALCLQVIPGGTPTNLLDAMAANDIEKMFRIVTGVEAPGTTVGEMAIIGTGTVVGSFLLLIMLFAFLVIAVKMLMATEAIVQNLSGISLGIPGVAFGALAAMVKTAFSMGAKTVSKPVGKVVGGNLAGPAGSVLGGKIAEKKGSGIVDELDEDIKMGGEKSIKDKTKESGIKEYKASRFEDNNPIKVAKDMSKPIMEGKSADKGSGNAGAGKSADSTAKATENAAKSAAKGVEQTTGAASKAMSSAGTAVGQGGRSAGQAMIAAGKGLTATIIGAPVGVALMAAGAVTMVAATAAEHALKAAAVAVKAAGKMAAAAIKVGGKAAATGMKAVKAGLAATSKIAKNANKIRKKVQKNALNVAKKAGAAANKEIDKNMNNQEIIRQREINEQNAKNSSDEKK